MNKTKIEWVKNPDGTQGYTWNPLTGCLNHINGMCKGGNFPCYAYRLAHGRLKPLYLANKNTAPPMQNILLPNLGFVEMNPFYPRFWPERLVIPTDRQKPRGIFTCDMSDLFGVGIPEWWTEMVILQIKRCPQHRFYLLTKQPQNLIKWSPFPDNCWVGVTITGGGFAIPNFITINADLGDFYSFGAKVKFISFEPLLYEPTPFALYRLTEAMLLKQVNWVIIGAQTKPYKPPEISWVEEIVEAADKAGIPVFLKDNLEPLLPHSWFVDRPSEDWAYTKLGSLRQEIPC